MAMNLATISQAGVGSDLSETFWLFRRLAWLVRGIFWALKELYQHLLVGIPVAILLISVLIFVVVRRLRRQRIADRADNTAESAVKTDACTTSVGCPNCQHVQALPRNQEVYVCEQCNAHLKRATAPAKSS
jgi:Flp pilus assembly protein TadB